VTDWAQVGVIVTGSSGALIAWQAWETRRTARAGNAGVDVGRRSLEISQALAIDSTKTRLDARAPRLLVKSAPTHAEVVMGPSGSGDPQPWPLDRHFRRTEDDHVSLILGAQIDVTNEGDRSQKVWIDGNVELLRPEGGNLTPTGGRITVFLGPGERCEFRLTESRTLKEWTESWQARQRGDTGPSMSTGHVICSDPYDEGVVDRWELQLFGNPVKQIQNDLAGWRIRNGHTNPSVAEVAVRQQTREYYLSKHEDKKLENAVRDTPPPNHERKRGLLHRIRFLFVLPVSPPDSSLNPTK
jgi:hypothetical protein